MFIEHLCVIPDLCVRIQNNLRLTSPALVPLGEMGEGCGWSHAGKLGGDLIILFCLLLCVCGMLGNKEFRLTPGALGGE